MYIHILYVWLHDCVHVLRNVCVPGARSTSPPFLITISVPSPSISAGGSGLTSVSMHLQCRVVERKHRTLNTHTAGLETDPTCPTGRWLSFLVALTNHAIAQTFCKNTHITSVI